MSFLHPEFLYYLLPPMFILFGFLLTQKESQAQFFSTQVMDKLRVSANTLTLKARNALFLLVGTLVVVALAQPVVKDAKIQIKAKSADIMIALDISDSMLAKDVYPSRLESAKQKALILLKDAPNERLGVLAFAKNSYLVSPLSFDASAVAFLLSKLDTQSITQKGTDFLSMLEVLANTQTKTEKKYLLLLSDGGDKSDFSKEISYAKKHNIIVFILGMGTKKGAPIRKKDGSFIKFNDEILISKLNENIATFATQTGGVYIENTVSSKDIKAMFNEMQRVSEKKELKSQEIQKYIPLFYYPLGIALFILLIAMSSMSKRVKVDVPNIVTLFLLSFLLVDLEAGVLDFLELDKAKTAYERGEYEQSAKIYEEHGKKTQNNRSYFNAANAYYKQKEYKKALELYAKSVDLSKEKSSHFEAKNFANMGNAQVELKEQSSLVRAKELYEKSLAIVEDELVRENLEAVKKELEKQKQEKQNKKQDQQKEKNKDNKQDKNKDQKNEDQKNEDEKNKDQNKQDTDESNSDNSSKKKEEKDKQENSKPDKSQENNETKEQKQELQNLSEEDNATKDEDKEEQKDSPSSTQTKQMSDAELQKWINQLQTKQKTYLYQLNKPKEGHNDNEKPW